MKAILPLLIAFFIGLSACGTMHSGSSPQSGADSTKSLAPVAGVWHFSHSGPPSVGTVAASEIITAESNKSLRDAKISIETNGEASIFALGQSMAFQIEVIEETPLFIKLGVDGHESAYTYDKSSKLLVLAIDLDADGKKGTMPAYFKRSRFR